MDQVSGNKMLYEWVTGYYEGEMAKRVLAHANEGVGYFIINSGGNRLSPNCLAAFRRPLDSARAEHLTLIDDPVRTEQLEQRLTARSGIARILKISKSKRVASLSKIFRSRS